jgi:hypothetical protein
MSCSVAIEARGWPRLSSVALDGRPGRRRDAAEQAGPKPQDTGRVHTGERIVQQPARPFAEVHGDRPAKWTASRTNVENAPKGGPASTVRIAWDTAGSSNSGATSGGTSTSDAQAGGPSGSTRRASIRRAPLVGFRPRGHMPPTARQAGRGDH